MLKGQYQVTDGVTILPTPGHSIGHQSIVIQKGSDFVYCGDAAPLKENLEKQNIPGVVYRADQALKSIDQSCYQKRCLHFFA
ncbi:MAG: hypothetical protein ACE5KD_01945 [Candidatus Bathyarchaeia archaeon]